MSRFSKHAVSVLLIAAGVSAWAATSKPLATDSGINAPLNPFGICRSPYGEVFAMAMQSPIDVYWHGQLGEDEHDHSDHVHDEHCDHYEHEDDKDSKKIQPRGFRANFLTHLEDLNAGVDKRTVEAPPSTALSLYLRREIENKLKFAYHLDPAHYANYNSYHFFLTQPTLGTRPQLSYSVAKLADQTIYYCLNEKNDPRSALTAAGAVCNIIELMFDDQRSDRPHFSVAQMRQQLSRLDLCITRYEELSKKWDQTNNWKLLSPMRIQECQDRISFILKIREAAAATIARLESGNSLLKNAP